jgi:uncharacterized protein
MGQSGNIMSKLLLFGLLAFLAYLFFRGTNRPKSGPAQGPRPAEQMVECAQCGVHLPEGESLRSGEHCYCCEAHRVLGPKKR